MSLLHQFSNTAVEYLEVKAEYVGMSWMRLCVQLHAPVDDEGVNFNDKMASDSNVETDDPEHLCTAVVGHSMVHVLL